MSENYRQGMSSTISFVVFVTRRPLLILCGDLEKKRLIQFTMFVFLLPTGKAETGKSSAESHCSGIPDPLSLTTPPSGGPHPPSGPIFFFKHWSVMLYGDVLKLFLKPRCMLQSIVRFDMFILLHLFKPDTVCWVGTLEREQSCSTSASWRTISWILAACAVGMYGRRDW